MQTAERSDPRLTDVLIVSDFADVTGGQAKVAIDTARLLAGAGLEVSFFAATGPVSLLLSHPKIRVTCLGQHTLLDNPSRMRAMLSGLWNRAAAQALRAEIARHDPAHTVILCHGWAKALSPAIGPVLTGGGLRCLYTMHEYFLACPNGGFYDYRAGEICMRKPLGAACLTHNCDARHAVHKGWRVARQALARGPGRLPGGLSDIAYISRTQCAAMAPYLPRDVRLHHLANPVASDAPPVDATANDAFVFVGRLSPEKGGAIFAEAAKRAGLRAVFVGDGPEAAHIRAINPQAEITGWVTPDEVQEHLACARAVVFPSLWHECQPLVPIEALLRGVPVVTGRWSAAHEVVEDGVNGVIYDRPDAQALADALGRVERIGPFESAGLAEAVSPARHVESLIAICEEMLGRPA
ncbi:glycosyltransferase family 4 protein [Thioclava sp. L04-15]|uniref:glycosyltransferase family 4 protein n=1 Tax=Thioclava sp. L04-15 TaxID=1915318 RepID=UPI0009968EC5|nr:glycosyltransferase family 4 protein [Thioclava sp. L04-15]TNE83016.1 MAG: glycosyltransferase [Paracoccaceae bacterium]